MEEAGAQANPALIYRLLDGLIATYAGGDTDSALVASLLAAKELFWERTGRVFDDDEELFEARIAAFLEWYVLDHDMPDRGKPPVRIALERADLSSEDRAALQALATSHWGLFDVVAVDADAVELEDVLAGSRFWVHERRSTAGFDVGHIVEARLLWDGERVVFGRTFVFHPREARDAILDVIEEGLARGESPQAIVFRLARLHVRWSRSRNIDAGRAYEGMGGSW